MRYRFRYPLLVAALLITTGCASIVADQIVAPQNPRRADYSTKYQQGLKAVLNAERRAYLTDDGNMVGLHVPAQPIRLSIDAKVRKNVNGSSEGDVNVTFAHDSDRTPYDRAIGTVVLLHGHGLSKEPMMPWASTFADAGFDAVALDLPGHGESTPLPITFSARESTMVRAVIDQLVENGAAEPVVLLGVSLGGSTAIQSAAGSNHIAAVIALAPFNDAREVIPNFRRLAPWWARALTSQRTLSSAIERADERAGFDFDDAVVALQLDGYATPTLVLVSAKDRLVPPAQSAAIAASSDSIELRVIDSPLGHIAFPSDLGERCREVLPWLSTILPIEFLADPCLQLRPLQAIMESARDGVEAAK